jgi:hypothetical protein
MSPPSLEAFLDAGPSESDLLSDIFSGIPPSEATESQTTTPIPSEPPPLDLERVGPTRKHIIWSDMNKHKFIKWWLSTIYGSKPVAEHPHWDKRGLTSDVWQYFKQGAEITTGQPCVWCKDCNRIFTHPIKYGTNAMIRHRDRCAPKQKGKQRQGDIGVFLANQVRLN